MCVFCVLETKCGAAGSRLTLQKIDYLCFMKENPFKYYLRNCRRRTQHEFNLTLDYLEVLWGNQNGTCPYSGVKLILNTHQKRCMDIRYSASLDRVDSSKGYTMDNVQFVSTAINYMKNNMSHDALMEFILIIKDS